MSEIGNQMEYIEELKYLENKEKERKEKARKRAKEHYYKYKETHLKANKRWRENNPEKVKEYEKKRYEKRKQLKQENERQKEVINGMIENEEKYLLEINKLKSIIKEVREYINHYETIRGYFEYEELGYDEYNYDEDLKQELLAILDKEK